MELKKICDRCGAAFDADSVYCKYCGVKRGIAENGEISSTDEAQVTPKRIGYCKYCGKRLRRNEICDCARSAEENKRQQKKKKEAAPDQQKEARQTKNGPESETPPAAEPAAERQPATGIKSVKPPVAESASERQSAAGMESAKPPAAEPAAERQPAAGIKSVKPPVTESASERQSAVGTKTAGHKVQSTKQPAAKPSPAEMAGQQTASSGQPANKRAASENPPKRSVFKWMILAIILLAIAAVVLACTWKGPDGGTAVERIIDRIEGFFGGNGSSGGVIEVNGGPDSVPQESTGDQEVPQEDTSSGIEDGSEPGDETPAEPSIKPANEMFMNAEEAAEAVSLLMDDYRMNSISKEELQTSMEEIRGKAEMDEGTLEEFEVELERITASHDAYYNGVENEENGLYMEAISWFRQVEADDGFYEEAKRMLGECETKYVLLVISSADGAVTEQRISDAEGILESALALFPQNQSLTDKLAEVQSLEPHLIMDSDVSDYNNLYAARAQGADSGDAAETGTYILRSNADDGQETYFVVAASGKYGSISGTVMISSTSDQIAPGEGGWIEIWADYIGDGNYERIYASPNELNQTTTAYGFGVDISGSQSVMLRLERTETAQGTLDIRLEGLSLDPTTESVLDGYSSEPPVFETLQ